MNNNVWSENFVLPNPSLSSPMGVDYVKKILKTSKKAYQTIQHKKIVWGDDAREGVDIFFPKPQKDPLPSVFFIHGGYCVNGCREMMGFMAPMVASLPAIFVSVGYKLAPRYKFKDSLIDCKNGFLCAYEQLKNYGGDQNNIILSGHSIGGTLASLLVLKKDLLSDEILNDAIKACIPISGIFNLAAVPEDKKNVFLRSEADVMVFSPLNIDILDTKIPFFLLYGEHDFPNIKQDQQPMLEKIKKNQLCEVNKLQLPAMDHFEVSLNTIEKNNPWMTYVKKSFYKNSINQRIDNIKEMK